MTVTNESMTARRPGVLTGSVKLRRELTTQQIEQLYGLFAEYYTRVDRGIFDRDLAAKKWVLLLEDEDGRPRGFTTLVDYELEVSGRRLRAVFNGNTIIDAEHWGQQELVRTWTRFMAERKAEDPSTPLYWYLISSGYRTYLFLPLFYRSFYPRHERPTPPFEQKLIDTLGRRYFPDEYQNGVIRVAEARECLRGDLAEPSAHKLKKPHIRFFVEANPGFRRGDELACVAEFHPDNIRGFPHKIARQVLNGESAS